MNDAERGDIESDVIKLRKAGADIETLLRFMRDRGYNEADSLQPFMRAAGLEMGNARDLIIESETWADHRENNIALQEAATQAWIELAEENDDPNFEIEIECKRKTKPI